MARLPLAVGALARLSWWVPGATLLLVGLSERSGTVPVLGLDGDALVRIAEAGSAVGLALGVAALLAIARSGTEQALRRTAVLGTSISGLMLVVTQVAEITGALSAREAERELSDALAEAVHDLPGWSGGTLVDGAVVHAVGIEPSAAAARLLERETPPFRVVMFGVNNAAGKSAVRLQVGGAVAVGAGGPLGRALSHDQAVARLRTASARDPVIAVPRGAAIDGIVALFDPAVSFERVVAVDVRVNGSPQRIPGRYFTSSEKRAIDARRGGAPGP